VRRRIQRRNEHHAVPALADDAATSHEERELARIALDTLAELPVRDRDVNEHDHGSEIQNDVHAHVDGNPQRVFCRSHTQS
jgi:CO/xanthine dehydrogenase FAD-binding subunit